MLFSVTAYLLHALDDPFDCKVYKLERLTPHNSLKFSTLSLKVFLFVPVIQIFKFVCFSYLFRDFIDYK